MPLPGKSTTRAKAVYLIETQQGNTNQFKRDDSKIYPIRASTKWREQEQINTRTATTSTSTAPAKHQNSKRTRQANQNNRKEEKERNFSAHERKSRERRRHGGLGFRGDEGILKGRQRRGMHFISRKLFLHGRLINHP